MNPPPGLLEALSEVADPRDAKGQRYSLVELLAIAVCAMLCGCRSLYAIAQWGRDHLEEVTDALQMPRRQMPCCGTFHYAFKKLDRDRFEQVLGRWVAAQGLTPGEAIALDGKSLRGIHGEQLPGVHLLAAYAQESGGALFQQDTGDKGNELTVAPRC